METWGVFLWLLGLITSCMLIWATVATAVAAKAIARDVEAMRKTNEQAAALLGGQLPMLQQRLASLEQHADYQSRMMSGQGGG